MKPWQPACCAFSFFSSDIFTPKSEQKLWPGLLPFPAIILIFFVLVKVFGILSIGRNEKGRNFSLIQSDRNDTPKHTEITIAVRHRTTQTPVPLCVYAVYKEVELVDS